MLGVVLVVLGVVWLLVQCGLGLPPLAEAMTLDPVVDPDRYWQFVFLGPALPVALGVFLLRYRIQGFAQLKRERINCAAHLLVSAGIALVLGKLCVLARASVSVSVQAVAFATGVPSYIYAFHRYTGNSTTLYHTLARQFWMQFPG